MEQAYGHRRRGAYRGKPLSAWFKAGVYCVGMGSKLFPKAQVEAGDWAYITDMCRKALAFTR